MAMEYLTTGGFLDGEMAVDSGVGDTWVGGQPAKLGSGGVSLLKGLNNAEIVKFYGFFKNMRTYDEAAQVQLNDSNATVSAAPINCTVVVGPQKLRFYTDGTDAAPFVYPGTGGAWAVGQEIFVDVNGKLDNAAANVSDKALGKVVKVPTSATDDMVVAAYGIRSLN